MKRAISALLALCLILSLLPGTALAAESGTCGENATWKLSNGILTISGMGPMFDYTAENNSQNPWYENSQIKAVTIESGITHVGAYAFYHCRGIAEINLPDSLLSIGESAFYYCDKLAQITVPDSVTDVGKAAFGYCSSLTSINIPQHIERICSSTYAGCNRITNIIVPNGVTSIENGAFERCTNLQSIIIPESVTSIGHGAFRECSNLKNITLPSKLRAIDGYTFYACGSLLTLKIPVGVSSIGANAFSCCRQLTDISIPNSVTSIGEYAFHQCDSLSSVVIPNSVVNLGSYAFFAATGLHDIVIPGSVLNIGQNSFYQCENLTTVTLKNGITSIGASAFGLCKNLTSISIPTSVTDIAENAFMDCTEVTICGVSKSYAETYAKENGISFIAEPNSSDYDDFSDDMLFREYPAYLNNPLYEKFREDSVAYIDRVCAKYDGASTFLAAYKYCLDSGGISVMLDELLSALGLANSGMEQKLARDIATELVLAADKIDVSYLKSISDDTSKALKDIKNISKLGSTGNEDILTSLYYNLIVSTFSDLTAQELSDAQDFASDLAKKLMGDYGKVIANVIEAANIGVDAFEYAALIISLQNVEIKTFDNLIVCFPETSPIRNALIDLKNDATSNHFLLLPNGIEHLFNEYYLDLIKAAVKDRGGKDSIASLIGASSLEGFLAGIAVKAIAHLIPGQSVDALVKAKMYYTAVANIEQTLTQLKYKAYNGSLVAEDIEKYKTTFSLLLLTQKLALTCAKEATKDDILKTSIENWLTLFDKASYSHYIELCKLEVMQKENLKYSIENGSATILGIDSSPRAVSKNLRATSFSDATPNNNILYIPEEIAGYPVTNIGNEAFKSNAEIEIVVFKPSLSAIGENAFSNCSNLENLIFLKPTSEIQTGAFKNCDALEAVTIPSGTQLIASDVFEACTSLKEIYIPISVKSIGDNSFSGAANDLVVTGDDSSLAKTVAESLNATYDTSIPSIGEIRVSSPPQKDTYVVGEAFDPTGLKLYVTYDNGTSNEVSSGYKVFFDSSTTGLKEAIILYDGAYTTFPAKVSNVATDRPNTSNNWYLSTITSSNTYAVALPTGLEHGKVTASAKTARQGDTVTLTPVPDEGYTLDSLTVTDSEGQSLSLTEEDGKFTFTMPAFKVTIAAAFVEQAPPVESAPAEPPFTDIAPTAWYYDDVAYVYQHGLMNGTKKDQLFSPEAPMTRAMLMTVLARYDGVDTTGGETWYSKALAWAVEKGVSSGEQPQENITREQLVTMLWRYAGRPEAGQGLDGFSDADAVSRYAQSALSWAVETGVLTGKTGNRLDPKGSATRAEVAAILARYCQSAETET